MLFKHDVYWFDWHWVLSDRFSLFVAYSSCRPIPSCCQINSDREDGVACCFCLGLQERYKLQHCHQCQPDTLLYGINHTTSKRNVILLRQSRKQNTNHKKAKACNHSVNVNTISFILIVRYNTTVKSWTEQQWQSGNWLDNAQCE